MSNYLYKISTKRTDVWSNKVPRPIYLVAKDKEYVKSWALQNLADGLSLARVTLLAEQVGGSVFASSTIKKGDNATV